MQLGYETTAGNYRYTDRYCCGSVEVGVADVQRAVATKLLCPCRSAR